MSRPWSRVARKTDIVAQQQHYQLPRESLRPIGVSYKYGSSYFPLREVGSELTWEKLNAVPSVTLGIPRFFFMKGKDLISIYPVPGSDLSEGLKVYFEPKQPRMVSEDFTSGTVTVTQGGASITHSAAGFTEDMIGRYFFLSEVDGYEYQVVDYTDTSTLVLENVYQGVSGSGKSFVIGVVPDIPSEYHDAIIDYCIARLYMRRKDPKAARDFMNSFDRSLTDCKQTYASPTSDQVVNDLNGSALNLFDVPPNVLT